VAGWSTFALRPILNLSMQSPNLARQTPYQVPLPHITISPIIAQNDFLPARGRAKWRRHARGGPRRWLCRVPWGRARASR